MYFEYLLFLICIIPAYGLEGRIVETPYGKIRGYYDKSYEGRSYVAYEGIPYAKPPIGELRFSDPQPPTSWKGIWEANFTTFCVQLMHASEPKGGQFIGEEDCLHLNIYVPQVDKKKLDVIIHIHGGAFMFGSATCYAGPKYLMDRDVVLITINYRVGPLGFLSTEDGVVPGNAGMKDQVAALKWIRDNIALFGGNPNSVTITGLSAGGSSVHFLYLSPLSKGLFHKGISLSGTALCNWALQEDALNKAKKLGTLVGCNYESTSQMVNCLKQRTARQITEAVRSFRPWLFNPFSPFSVVVDDKSDAPFLPEHPFKLLSSGKIHDLPWLNSVTADEGLYPAADFVITENHLPYLNKNWEAVAPHILHYDYTVSKEKQAEVSNKIREYYLQDKTISRKTFNELIQLTGDRLFIVDAEKATRLHVKSTKSPVYFYYFDYHGEEKPSIVSILTHYDSKYGVSHGDDVMYIFSMEQHLHKFSEQDKNMKNVLLDIWMSFIKTGRPTIKNLRWEPVENGENFKYLHIKSPQKMIFKNASEMGHRSFWDSLPIMENEKLFNNKRIEL